MLTAARSLLRRFGALGVLLMVLGAVAPSGEAQACAPGQAMPETVSQAVTGVPALQSDGCQDCGTASCLHGCCHAAHAGLPGREAAPVATSVRFRAPTAWTHVVGEPFGAPAGPERPPRA
jgi:hypothetical protein